MGIVSELIKKKKVKTLVKALFNITLTDTQTRIVKAIMYEEARKITIKAYTQYGKTLAVAIGICLHKLTHEGNKYRLIASQDSKTQILRNYMVEHMINSKYLADMLDLEATGISRLRKEVSRRRLTFKDGDDILMLSAEGDAMRLMGHGGNIIVIDETGEIDPTVYKEKIMRMVAGFPPEKTMIIEIGNPWNPLSHFAEHWDDPRSPTDGGWLKIHVPYTVGVSENRTTESFIEESRAELVPAAFRVLYDAEFPEEAENQLIRREWFEKAMEKDMKIGGKIKAGCDVAEFGLDETVVIQGITDGRNFVAEKIRSWGKCDTMQTVSKLREFVHENAEINIDATGVGSGVHARMKELNYNAYAYKGGEKPDLQQDSDKFRNLLACFYWQLRDAFEQERIDLHNLKRYPMELTKLKSQLLSIRYEVQSDRRIKIIKKKKESDKSPDYADTLMLFVGKSMVPGFYVP